jgi:glycosyltransferase involved in cell wall biosynthesis
MALARYLPKDQFQLTICSLRINGFDETAPLLEKLGCRVLVARFRPRGRKFRHFHSAWKDQKLIERYGPFDIQHSLDFTSSPLEALFSRIYSRVYIFTQKNLCQYGYKAAVWVKIRLAKKIVSISDAVSQLLYNLGAEKQRVEKIPHGIERVPIDPWSAVELESPQILSVGHIQPLKRQQDAINVLAMLTAEIPNLSLLIAGEVYDPNYFQALQSLLTDLGLERQVRFLGVRDDIPQLMKSSSALLLCSESESFSWVVLEAMSVGLPVVASDCGGPGEIITPGLNGVLIGIGDIDGYAKALRQIILDHEWASSLSQNALDLLATKYSPEAMVARYVEMYKSLV